MPSSKKPASNITQKTTMKHLKLFTSIVGIAVIFGGANALQAGVVSVLAIQVDMDTSTPGIQSFISVAPGTAFSVDLWATVPATGLSSFSISTTFDTTELQLNPPAGPAASQPALPSGLAPFLAPVENNALGQVYSFNGGTLGLGPVSTSFIFGSIAFTAPTPVTNAINDVNVGYFNLPGVIDDSSNNAGASYSATTVFTGGRVDIVPEPTGIALLAGGMAMVMAARRRRTA
jgi:hypothetical protein